MQEKRGCLGLPRFEISGSQNLARIPDGNNFSDTRLIISDYYQDNFTSKKKSNAICYHFVRESVAMGETLTCHIPTDRNLADLQTKVTYGQKRKRLVRGVLYDIYDYE